MQTSGELLTADFGIVGLAIVLVFLFLIPRLTIIVKKLILRRKQKKL
jgi:hypothetical protein